MDATEDAASRRPGRSGDSELHRFGSSQFGHRLTLGVEEELMLVNAETLELAPGVERLLGPEGLKTELFSCLIETNTPVCESAAEARDELVRLRGVVREAAANEGLAVAAAGTHPFSRAEEQEIVAEPRYLKMLEELGPKLRRQLVCGLHVHVGMESFDELPADARGDPSLASGRPRALAQLAVPAGRGDGRALGSGSPAGRAATRGAAAILLVARGLGVHDRRDRTGLHAQLVGRPSASAPRHARGADRRPADGCRPLGGARRADPGALCRSAGRDAGRGAERRLSLAAGRRCRARRGPDG